MISSQQEDLKAAVQVMKHWLEFLLLPGNNQTEFTQRSMHRYFGSTK